jgi:hypothetical protein
MIMVQPSVFSSQLSFQQTKPCLMPKQANKGLSVQCMIIDELQESAFADSLLLRAEGLKK